MLPAGIDRIRRKLATVDDGNRQMVSVLTAVLQDCLLYTSDAADERSSVDLGGRRIIKKKKKMKSRT